MTPTHPWDILAELLKQEGITTYRLEQKLKISSGRLSNMVAKRNWCGAMLSKKLEKYFWIPRGEWTARSVKKDKKRNVEMQRKRNVKNREKKKQRQEYSPKPEITVGITYKEILEQEAKRQVKKGELSESEARKSLEYNLKLSKSPSLNL